MNSLKPSIIRTLAPIIAGYLLSIPLLAALATVLGIDLDHLTTLVAVGLATGIPVVQAIGYVILRRAERRWPVVGEILAKFGWPAEPTYEPKHLAR